MNLKTISALIAASMSLICCTNEGYESGDSRYSGMRAEFSEAATDGTGAFVSFQTDGGESLPLAQSYKPEWAGVADTTYRVLVYYEPISNGQGIEEASLMGLKSVIVPNVQPASEFKEGVKADPVSFNSAWISASQRYLNIDFSVKTGVIDGSDVIQLVGMALDTVAQNSLGHRTFSLRLYHNQGNAPEYYSSQHFLSVPLYCGQTAAETGDSVLISIQTYDGTVSKGFAVKQ